MIDSRIIELVTQVVSIGKDASATYDLELLNQYNEERESLYYCYNKDILDKLFNDLEREHKHV